MEDAWGEMLREEFPHYTDEQIHDLIDVIEEQVAEASMFIYSDVVHQARWDEQYVDKG